MSSPPAPEPAPPVSPRRELLLRTASAVVLAAVALAAVWIGGWAFALLAVVAGIVASWEWGRVVRGNEIDALLVLHAVIVVAAVLVSAAGYALPAAIALIVGSIVLLVLRSRANGVLTGLGVAAVGLPAVGIVWLRGDSMLGMEAVLFLFGAVWATDVAAFAVGRTLGGPRLWPAVSPAKTWSGAIGGLAAGLLAGVVASYALGLPEPMWLALLGLGLALAAEIGDMSESALKRRFDRKDASNIIPGHGGLLDRVDGLLAASLLAAVVAMLRDPMHPAAGLLLWR